MENFDLFCQFGRNRIFYFFFYCMHCNFLYINLRLKATCFDSVHFGKKKFSSNKSLGENVLEYKHDRAAVTLYIKK